MDALTALHRIQFGFSQEEGGFIPVRPLFSDSRRLLKALYLRFQLRVLLLEVPYQKYQNSIPHHHHS
jgi:hypothetical protein